MVDFHKDWYNNLITHSNEKHLLVEKISDLLKGKTHESCLEIGLGTSAYFAERLNEFFNEYWIVEKNKFDQPLPPNVKLINDDFEKFTSTQKFDVIIASHVVYYFKDLPKTIRKIVGSLKENGRAYFVVNGKESDYGPIKDAFATFIKQPYHFTYDILKSELKNYQVKEYTAQASVSFNSYEDLYETLRLSFDLYPKEYEDNKQKVIDWLRANVKGDKFFIDQKIIEVSKKVTNNEWASLLSHDRHELKFGDTVIIVENGVFTPNPEITYSTSMILENIPSLSGMRVIDIGTGTGVIAIESALWGAKEVIATDISDIALENATTNIKKNNVDNTVKVVKTSLLNGIEGKFDFIFANMPILDEVWASGNIEVESIIESLLVSAKSKLNEGGKIYIPWGSFAEKEKIKLEELLSVNRYQFELHKKDILGYTWYLYIVSKKI